MQERIKEQEPVTGILPCPFCGDSELGFTNGNTHRWGVAYCAGCGASAGETRREYPDGGKWHEEAIKQWNTRFDASLFENKGLKNDQTI